MITPSYGSTATERVLPRMALDFTTGVLDPRVVVTRALNTATRVNSSGLIETVNAGTPRFDYNPVTLVLKGLLIEETRANLLIRSSELENAAWSRTAVAISQNAATSPDGTLNAEKLIADTASSSHQIAQNSGTLVVGATYTQSVYVKASEYTFAQIRGNTPNNNYIARFNLSTGELTSSSNVVGTPTIVNAGNGWWRLTASFSPTAATSGFVYISLVNNSQQTTFSGDNVSGIYVWGAQLEAGAFATSYIPTTTLSLTRNSDVAAMTGSNFSSWWQATTGGLLVRAKQSVITGTRPWAYINDGTVNNIISLRGNAADPELYIKATTDQVQIDAGTLVANTSYNMVGAWNTDNCAAAINGGSPGTDSSAAIPTVDRMLIGSDGTNYLNGWVEKMEFWPQRITNAETQAFSK